MCDSGSQIVRDEYFNFESLGYTAILYLKNNNIAIKSIREG